MSEGAASLINLSWTWFALDTKMMMLRRRLGWMVSVYVAAAGVFNTIDLLHDRFVARERRAIALEP